MKETQPHLPDDIYERINEPYPDREYWLDWVCAVAEAGGWDTSELLKEIREKGQNISYPKDLS